MSSIPASSQSASALLHLSFLLIAFTAPVTSVLDDYEVAVPDRLVTLQRPLEPATPPPIATTPRGIAEGAGPGDGEPGPRPEVAGDGDSPPRGNSSRTAVTGAPAPEGSDFVADVAGILAGVANADGGLDAETRAGFIDDGGGARPFGTMFGMAGRGISCFHVWERMERRELVAKRGGCSGIEFALARGAIAKGISSGLAFADKEEARVPVVQPGRVHSCTVASDAADCADWKDIIERVIRRHKRELEFCYDRALDKRRRAFDAVLDLAFHIEPGGGRAHIELASTSGLGSFDSCVHARAEKWIFPKTGFAIRANYPFRFSVL